MSKKRTPSALAARLDTLGIDAAELAAILKDRYPVELVGEWIDGSAEPDAEARVLLRVLDDAHRAQLAVAAIRGKRTMNLSQGEDWQTRGLKVPYGSGHQGTTGGPPQ